MIKQQLNEAWHIATASIRTRGKRFYRVALCGVLLPKQSAQKIEKKSEITCHDCLALLSLDETD
jgi:hypothetical protein